VEFFSTPISERAVELAVETLRSGRISEGERGRAFETALAERCGLIRPVALNSGTAALHLALALSGVGPADEVILPAQTFIATGMAILMRGATPVFADIDPETGNLAPESVRRKLTERSRAILPVHWGGCPCDLEGIHALARERKLSVIEDAAHAFGASYRGKPIGACSRFTAFSFQAIKHLTTGDGGALCCLEAEDYPVAVARRWFGIDRAKSRPSILGERVYDVAAVGYKYHMNDLAAAVGLGNLDDFPKRLARRRRIAAVYREQLAKVPGLRMTRVESDRESADWLFTVLVERREVLIRKLAAEGIPTSIVHGRIDRNAVFGGPRPDLPGQAEFEAQHLCLPLHAELSDADRDRVVAAVRKGW